MDRLINGKIMDANSVFGSHYLDSRSLYLCCFHLLPTIHFINGIEGEKAYKAFKEAFAGLIVSEHQYRWYDRKRKCYRFDDTLFILRNHCLVELKNYCEILHDGKQEGFLQNCTDLMNRFKQRNKRRPLEINLIVQGSDGLELKSMEVKRARLDLDLFYEDDFKNVDAVIQHRLRKENDKGIVLLHGLPGTGKTTYLRYLIGKIRKRVLFVSPGIAGDLLHPNLIELLIDNPNTVLIIEDAEHIITDRRSGNPSQVSNLLNLSDGLLADFLNIQLICTFNSPLTLIDQALLRKGRLIAKYEFGRLGVGKAQRLSKSLGFERMIQQPMTLAEICNQEQKEFSARQMETIGFRRTLIQNGTESACI